MLTLGEISFEAVEQNHISFLVKSGNAGGLVSQKHSKKRTSMLAQQTKVLENSLKNSYYLFVIYGAIANPSNRNSKEQLPIGLCEIVEIDWVNKTCLLYLYFEDGAEGIQQYGNKSLTVALKYLFHTVGIRKVLANVVVDNVAMTTLYKQRGFKLEVRKRAHYFNTGIYKTVVEMGLLATEFEEPK